MNFLTELNEQANKVCNELIAAKRARKAAKTKADAAYHAGREEELEKWLGSLEKMITQIIERSNATLCYRPCVAEGKKARFLRWTECSRIVEPSPLIGGHNGGVLKWTAAIVEFEDGKLAEVLPSDIQFINVEREDAE